MNREIPIVDFLPESLKGEWWARKAKLLDSRVIVTPLQQNSDDFRKRVYAVIGKEYRMSDEEDPRLRITHNLSEAQAARLRRQHVFGWGSIFVDPGDGKLYLRCSCCTELVEVDVPLCERHEVKQGA